MNTVTADDCRAMGLEVGDTIEGTESGEGWWNMTGPCRGSARYGAAANGAK
jgi:hypothetical protein